MTATEARGVVHVLGELRASGAEVLVLGEARRLPHRPVRVIATGPTVGEAASTFVEQGIDVVHIPFAPDPRWLLAIRAAVPGRSVVHVHPEQASFWVGLTLRLGRLRVVRSIHSVFLFDGWLRIKRTVQRQVLSGLGVSHVAVSDEVARNERTRFGLRTTTLRNGPEERFIASGATREQRPEVRCIATVGNCEHRKNHRAVIEALAELRQDGVELRYLHAGSARSDDDDEPALAERLDVADLVDRRGVTDPLAVLTEADVFVMPSLREGIPLAALEAIAAGVPTVVADVPGLRGLAGVPGLWWSGTDPSAVAGTLRELRATAAPERHARAAAARRALVSSFSLERRSQALEQLYSRGERTRSGDASCT